MNRFRELMSMIRFSHTLFALPFALLAALMAWVTPATVPVQFCWWHLVGILLAMVGARSAAMAFNRLADRNIDAANPRTANRHLPAGRLTVQSVWWFTLGSIAVYLAGAAMFWPNYLPVVLALPVLAILLAYSYMKRFTAFAHFWLGLALMLAPICAWIAVRGLQVIADPLDLLAPVLLGLAVMFWVAGFDMIYACQDYEFDREAGLHSVPVWLGVAGALRLAAFCHGLMLVFLIALPFCHVWGGPELKMSWLYFVGVAAIGALLVYEHWLVKPTDLSRVNQAFFNVNAIVSIGLLVVAGIDMIRP
ncbi:MAG: putative 4-hydroxybenzoate polyprenyltransferase [Pirellulaceae bacterium]|nr:putative 4-hydroxybenzoate polyprenyltransferase [Pirellulaceae bacterium]